MRPQGPIRILVIDDYVLLRRALAGELERMRDLHATFSGGTVPEVRERLTNDHPEVIVLDLGLHSGDPFLLLRKLRANYPVPVIVMAEQSDAGARASLRAQSLGAFDVVQRPIGCRQPAVATLAAELAQRVTAAVRLARPVRPALGNTAASPSFRSSGVDNSRSIVAIGASTGGTEALATLFKRLPADFPPTVIVQHMPVGFTRSFAERLNGLSAIQVTEAADGDIVRPGCAVIARGDTHLTVRPAGHAWVVRYTDRTLVNRHCPSVDVLFDSVAVAAGARGVGVLLTGMGADGARGLLKMRQHGAVTIGQSEESCVVFGMPKEAGDLGAVQHWAPPAEIPALVLRCLQHAGQRTAAPAK